MSPWSRHSGTSRSSIGVLSPLCFAGSTVTHFKAAAKSSPLSVESCDFPQGGECLGVHQRR